jgi:ABC-type multidrug transport system permease subunit
MDYRTFLLPGLAAMSAMNHGYALSMDLNISRFYWKTFDEIRTAPVSDLAYVLGEGLSGAARGLLASLVVLLMGWCFRVPFCFSPALVLSLALTALVFAFLAISTALLARNHSDQALLSNFVITPMAFLCGTLFPLDAYPHWLQGLMQVLPLTPATRLVRASAWGQGLPWGSLVLLVGLGAVCFGVAVLVVRRTHEEKA